MRFVSVATLPLAVGVLLLAGCSEAASYDQKRDYLRTVALRGAETHALIAASEGTPDDDRCKAAHGALIEDIPNDVSGGGVTKAWRAQVEAFFVDSCISGKPKELPPLGPPATPAPTGSPTAPPPATGSPAPAVTP